MADKVLNEIDRALDESLKRLFALMKIPSISTDPAYAKECRRAAEWLAKIWKAWASPPPSAPRPAIRSSSATMTVKGPHVLFYGHYDVQPVDPLNLWDADPFAAALRTRADGAKEIFRRVLPTTRVS